MHPWHHIHVTVEDREAAAIWHDQHTEVVRVKPTPRSEQLFHGPNLIQIQSNAVASEPNNAVIEAIGMSVTDLPALLSDWTSAKGTILSQTAKTALVLDPWGVPFEFVQAAAAGHTHITVSTPDPDSLLSWYEENVGGEKCDCDWDNARLGLQFDTIMLCFRETQSQEQNRPWGPLDHLGWVTENLDKSYEEMTANNVKFPVKPREFGRVRIAFAADPCGIWFELVEPPDGDIRIIKPNM